MHTRDAFHRRGAIFIMCEHDVILQSTNLCYSFHDEHRMCMESHGQIS